ncbi:MAG: hypothetical protein HY360_09970 [Verrucomicrobia bacterium]|nr:hypothetical protein [Verrucomicrobiota bacterium]
MTPKYRVALVGCASSCNARQLFFIPFEAISGRLHEYISDLKPDMLDATRREMADAIVEIEKRLKAI